VFDQFRGASVLAKHTGFAKASFIRPARDIPARFRRDASPTLAYRSGPQCQCRGCGPDRGGPVLQSSHDPYWSR